MELKSLAVKSWNIFVATVNAAVNTAVIAGIAVGVYFLAISAGQAFIELNGWALIKQELSGDIKVTHALVLLSLGGLIYWGSR